jgi:VanZ family protein
MLVVLVVLLLPSPREWWGVGDWLSPRYDRMMHIIQPLAHVVLMAVLACLIMKCIASKSVFVRMFTTFLACMVVAGLYEASQSFLPEEFGRSSDVADLVYAAMGASLGCLLGLSAQFSAGKES